MKNQALNFVIDAASATTTDNFALLSEVIHVGSALTTRKPVGRYLSIAPGSVVKTVAVAETLQVDTWTPVGTANSVTYSLKITQLNPITGEIYQPPLYLITTPATGTVSPTTIVTQFKTIINADTKLNITASGAATLVLTAKTGYAGFTSSAVDLGGGFTVANTTAAVYPFGLTPYYDLQRAGLVAANYTGSTAGYTRYTWNQKQTGTDNNTLAAEQPVTVNVFINTDSGNAAGLITAINAIFAQAAFNAQTVKLL